MKLLPTPYSLLPTHGFTLMELAVAVAVIALVVVLSITTLPRTLGSRELDRAVSDTTNLLNEARQLTLASKDEGGEGSQYGVWFVTTTSPHMAILFKGGAYDSTDASKVIRKVAFKNIEISELNFSTSTLKNVVVFQRLTGITNNPGSVTFMSKKSCTQGSVSVNNNGAVTNVSASNPRPAWNERHRIKINYSGGSNLQNFPLLVRIPDGTSDLMKTYGEDLRFYDADDQTLLDYEIESFSQLAESVIWVRVPQLDACGDHIYMYFKNMGVGSIGSGYKGINPSRVWDANYVAVWHLGDSINPKDSTIYGHNGVGASASVYATGQVAGGQDFNGGTSKITVANTSATKITSNLSIEAWARWNTLITPKGFILQNYGCCYPGFGFGIRTIIYQPDMQFFSSVGGWKYQNGSLAGEADPQWFNLGMTLSPTGLLSFYKNGVQVGTSQQSGIPTANNAANLYIGHYGFDNSLTIYGQLDEVRLSNTMRSPDWLKASYENQKSGSTFVTIE